MIKRIVAISIGIIGLTGTMNAQLWTLMQCLDYALKHNLTIQQQVLQGESAKFSLKSAKAQYLPSIEGFAYENINNSVNQINATEHKRETYTTGQIGVSSTFSLWEGFKNNYIVHKNELLIEQSNNLQLAAIQDMSLSITSAYLDVLYYTEQAKILQNQLMLTKAQIDRTQLLIDAGSVAKIELSRLQLQRAQENNQLITAQQNITLANVSLTQLMNLKGDSATNFSIIIPELPNINDFHIDNADSIFQNVCKIYPNLKAKELSSQMSEQEIKIAKSSGYPYVFLKGQLYTTTSGIQKRWDDASLTMPFSDQLDNNAFAQISLGVTIPIWNKWNTRNTVSQAKISKLSSDILVEQEKNNIFKLIQQSWIEANAAKEQYKTATQAVSFANEAYSISNEQYNMGLMNGISFLQEKNNVSKTESELILAKYQLLFKLKLLDIMQGKTVIKL